MKINPNGTRYDGEWVNGKPHGKGTSYYNDGSKYEGFYVNGLFNGIGTKTFKDGTFYKGRIFYEILKELGKTVS